MSEKKEELSSLLPSLRANSKRTAPEQVKTAMKRRTSVLEEKLEGGTGNEAPDEDRENEGGEGRDNVSESAQTHQIPGEARSETGQSALSPQGQGEGAASQPAREAPGPGEGSQDDGPQKGRPDQREGQEEVVEPDQDPVLQPLQPLEG